MVWQETVNFKEKLVVVRIALSKKIPLPTGQLENYVQVRFWEILKVRNE